MTIASVVFDLLSLAATTAITLTGVVLAVVWVAYSGAALELARVLLYLSKAFWCLARGVESAVETMRHEWAANPVRVGPVQVGPVRGGPELKSKS